MSALEGPKADATETPHFPKGPEVLGTPSKFFGALRAQHITPPPLASGGRARRTFQFSDLVGSHFLLQTKPRTHKPPVKISWIFYLTNPETDLIRGHLFCPGPGAPVWGEARNPGSPAAVSGELEGIPEEVFGWNGSELNSGGIHVRFSRNRRWNSGGWHRPGKAESGGFSRCRGPPDFFRAAARGSKFVP